MRFNLGLFEDFIVTKIRRLPESLVAKIAAGEVVERPFSVIKELVENAIDAGATQIEIEAEDGGRKRMAVIDDGCGMTEEEALLSLERHATSKLANEEDLFRIRTLGFRGEALPSIAAVSFMTLESRRRDSTGPAVRIEIQGGEIVRKMASSLPRGTRISIENLFFNTPARLKFLKSKETEFSHIAVWIESIALSRPDIGFVLKHNGKVEIRSVSQKEMRERIGEILGMEIAEFLHPVEANRGQLRLTGFVSDHRAGSTQAKSLFFYVNGRIVRDRTLQHAVLNAYEGLLMKHRYPWAVLHLSVPPEFVDVNVHPTKSEVRFTNGRLVHELVREGVREVLSIGRGVSPAAAAELAQPFPLTPHEGLDTGAPLPIWEREIAFPETVKGEGVRIIGQVHGTYLICETPEKMILIDQHAAHERIGFEKLKGQYESGGLQRQHLLIPQNFDLRPSQGEVLKKYLDDLAHLGLEIEFFGGNTFILRTIPTLLEGTDVVSLVEELIESLQSFEKLTPFDEKVHQVLERMACHQQVRAGDRLTHEEIEALLKEMGTTRFSGQCPHGRPSVLEVPFDEIEKWFKRRV